MHLNHLDSAADLDRVIERNILFTKDKVNNNNNCQQLIENYKHYLHIYIYIINIPSRLYKCIY